MEHADLCLSKSIVEIFIAAELASKNNI